MLTPQKISESRNVRIKEVKSQSVVECRFPQSSEIAEITAAEPQLALVSCEAASGRVNYSGKLVLTIVYSDEEGKLCRMQKGAEFSHFVDDEEFAPAQNCVCALSCEKLNVKRDGSSFVVSAVISAQISVYARRERTYYTGAEGVFLNKKSVNFLSPVCFSGESEVEDDFEADSVVDVLIPSAKAVVLSATCGSAEVELSGEIYLSLFVMKKQSPACIERTIPFKSVLVCDEASVGKNAVASVEITDLNVNASVNEERGKCNLNVVCSLTFNGWFCDEHSEDVAVDAFSDTCGLTLERAEESASVCLGIKVYSEKVSSLAATKSRLGYDCTFLAAVLPQAECEYNADTGAAEGVVLCTLLYMQNGELKSCEVTMPFAITLNGVAAEGESVILNAAAYGVAVRLRAEGEAEAEATVKICATVLKKQSAEYISSVEEGKELEKSEAALSVYIPAAGDDLWNVAKKLNKSPEEVAACNPALTFPLTGKERILLYRQKV